MSPKGDDNDNRPLAFNAKQHDDVSMNVKALVYLHTYVHTHQTIIFNMYTYIYHEKWVVTTCIRKRYLTVSFSYIIKLQSIYTSAWLPDNETI